MATHYTNNESILSDNCFSAKAPARDGGAYVGRGKNLNRSRRHKIGEAFADCSCVECLAAFTPQERIEAKAIADAYINEQNAALLVKVKSVLLRERIKKNKILVRKVMT